MGVLGVQFTAACSIGFYWVIKSLLLGFGVLHVCPMHCGLTLTSVCANVSFLGAIFYFFLLFNFVVLVSMVILFFIGNNLICI